MTPTDKKEYNQNINVDVSITDKGGSKFKNYVYAITESKNDKVETWSDEIREANSTITITEKGIGRCTKLSEYRLKSRGQKGILNYKTSKKIAC